MMIKKILTTVWNEFIYGGHLQTLGGVGIIYVSGVFLKIQTSWDILISIYLITYPPYLYNRFKEIEIDALTNSARTDYLRRYLKAMPLILYLAVIALAIMLLLFTNLYGFIFGMILLVLGFLYSSIFKKLTKIIPLFKNFYVALSFSLLGLFLPVYYSYPLWPYVTASFIIFLAFIVLKAAMMQFLLDLKDIEGDKKICLKTLPIILGKEKTLNLVNLLNILLVAPLLIIFTCFISVFPKEFLILLFVIPFNFYCVKLIKKGNYAGYLFESAEFAFWAFLILLVQLI